MTWTVVRIYLIYVHLLCFQVTREVQHNFSFLLKALSFKHEPEVFKMNSGFQDKSMTKECQMAVKPLSQEGRTELACFIHRP